jgi:hypothetical protein
MSGEKIDEKSPLPPPSPQTQPHFITLKPGDVIQVPPKAFHIQLKTKEQGNLVPKEMMDMRRRRWNSPVVFDEDPKSLNFRKIILPPKKLNNCLQEK